MPGSIALHDVYAISDLHMCGRGDAPMFAQGPLLAGLVRHVTVGARERPTALVLNGDTFDFLAHAHPGIYMDVAGAADTLAGIVRSPALRPVFDALAELLRQPHALLVVAIGNHDIELGLPSVQAALVHALCGADAAARGRLVLAVDGTGFACTVGGRRVLFLHGNEVDPWNVVDHERLRRLRRSLLRGVSPEVPPPNAGTRLVVDVMNGIKAQHRFVDLLKPELEAVVPILLALGVSPEDAAWRGIRIARRWATDRVRLRTGLLQGEAEGGAEIDPDLRVAVQEHPHPAAQVGGDRSLLERVEDAHQSGQDPRDLADSDGVLGWRWTLAKGIMKVRPGAEALRRALQERGTAEDLVDPTLRDETSTKLGALVGPAVDVLVAGHTHVARSLWREEGGFYLNSGTWADLIHLHHTQVETAEAFAPVFEALRSGDPSDLVRQLPTVVRVWRSGDRVMGVLHEAHARERGAVELLPVQGSEAYEAPVRGGAR